MSVVGSLDAIADKAQDNMATLKRAYAVGVAADVNPIPRGIDDTPVGIVRIGAGQMESGNHEHVVFPVTLECWAAADNPAWANDVLMDCIDEARDAFRADMNLGGEAQRCQMVGWDELENQTVGDRTYLILPIRLEVLITRHGHDATA